NAIVVLVLLLVPIVRTDLVFSATTVSSSQPTCRYLPTDAKWPDQTVWDHMNQTVGGRLIRGVPLGQPCYTPQFSAEECSRIQEEWVLLSPFIADPVNFMSPYWMNNSCSPFLGPNGSCMLGNLASYALDVNSAEDAIAGIRFAQDNNIRLTIKNTGHDFLGRSAGAGSLALWTHNLDEIAFVNYSSPLYTGPAVRIGAGVEYQDLYLAASSQGYRVVGGSCSTVGVTGGFSQGGGHGPLGAAYGLGADQVLEWEVVTAAGQHLTVSPMNDDAELYWALSGGGAGNFALVLSVTVQAHVDGPVAGAAFSFVNIGDDIAYWAAVSAWLRTLIVLDTIDGLTIVWTITAGALSLEFATLPDVTTTDVINNTLAPFFTELAELNVSLTDSYKTDVHANFAEYYDVWVSQTYTSNISIGGRLIPRSMVQDQNTALPALVAALRGITSGGAQILGVAANVTHGNYTPNAVLPSWRDALFTMSFATSL
ncbi:FAD-linked oxidoreductase patO, partial [Lachnellula arida]